jgi:TonB family protein
MKGWVLFRHFRWSWFLTLGTYTVFITFFLWVSRSHNLDLTVVSLDSDSTQATALDQPVIDDAWQKPLLRRMTRSPVVKSNQKPTSALPAGPTAEQGTGMFRSTDEVSQLPRFKTKVTAIYPDAARSAGIAGVVVLEVDIDAAGNVANVAVAHGLGYGCDEAAMAAMKQDIFMPAYKGLTPVPVRIRIPYRFRIDG